MLVILLHFRLEALRRSSCTYAFADLVIEPFKKKKEREQKGEKMLH